MATATPVFTPEILTAFSTMAVNNPEQYELVSVTLPEDVREKIAAAVLVLESEKAAKVLDKWLISEDNRPENFGDLLTEFLTGSNRLAEVMTQIIRGENKPVQGPGSHVKNVRQVVFPTKYGALTVKVSREI